jgi:two-component system, OmpR family, alkaline phosphatase synthesis response regulator PhoP
MKTILVVDDEKDILDLVKYNLQKEGYSILTARNGTEAIQEAQKIPHLVLLDIMMPEKNGFDVLKELKSQKKTSNIPVIFLTAKGSEIDEVLGLELGADDYIVKPISIPRLVARVKSVLSKKEIKSQEHQKDKSIRIGMIEILPSQFIVRVDKKEIFFPKKEFQILIYLGTRLDEVVSRETLLREIWGSDIYVVDRTVDVHIRKIREKLGKYADYIETIKGMGYKIREQT